MSTSRIAVGQVQIVPNHVQAAVAEQALQSEHIPAVAEVLYGEGVSELVRVSVHTAPIAERVD